MKFEIFKLLFFLGTCLALAAPAAPRPFAPPAPTIAPDEPICVLDVSECLKADLANPDAARRAWDMLHFAASLQGIVNRKGPRLFLRFMPETDDFWFAWCTTGSGWLKGRPVMRFAGMDGLLQLASRYANDLAGCVIYPERPYALSNVASTLAGVERRVALRADPRPGSLMTRYLAHAKRPQNVLDLRTTVCVPRAGSCGSAKNDAYRWVRERTLDHGLCSAEYMAFYIDAYYLADPRAGGAFSNATLSNHDFYIANGAFFFDLDVWGDEKPNDDPEQPMGCDLETLRGLLKAQALRAKEKNFIIGGFPPWAWKYADPAHRFDAPDGRRHPVHTEWEYSRMISSYGAIKDADALSFSGLANASFYRFYPLKDRYPQTFRAPSEAAVKAQGAVDADGKVADRIHLTWYMGDYDAAAWLNHFSPQWWRDPSRGRTMCSWAFDPILAVRVPQAMDYVRTHAAETDYFMAGDNGFGYLMPSRLSAPRLDPELSDGWNAWRALNEDAYRRFDIRITGFIIDPRAATPDRRVAREYAKFSPDGFVLDEGQPTGSARVQDGVPYVKMYLDLYGEPDAAAAQLADRLRKEPGRRFILVRTILKSPTWHRQTCAKLQELMGSRLCLEDPPTFFELARRAAEEPLRERR